MVKCLNHGVNHGDGSPDRFCKMGDAPSNVYALTDGTGQTGGFSRGNSRLPLLKPPVCRRESQTGVAGRMFMQNVYEYTSAADRAVALCEVRNWLGAG